MTTEEAKQALQTYKMVVVRPKLTRLDDADAASFINLAKVGESV